MEVAGCFVILEFFKELTDCQVGLKGPFCVSFAPVLLALNETVAEGGEHVGRLVKMSLSALLHLVLLEQSGRRLNN